MKAMQRDAFGVTVIEFSGRLDVETSQAFKALCGKLGQQRVTFNMRKLVFVGSTGIVTFMEALKDCVAVHRAQINFCEVGLDFSKLILASPLRYVGIYDSEQAAVQWHLLNPHQNSQLCEDDFVMQKEEEAYDASVVETEDSDSLVAS